MRTSWAVVALGLGMLSAGTPARAESVVGDYLPVVRIAHPAPAAPIAHSAQAPAPAAPANAPAPPAALPAPVATTPAPAPPAYHAPSYAPTYPAPHHYGTPINTSGPTGYGCSSCQSGCCGGSGCKDPCFCGYPAVWGSVNYLHLWFKDAPAPPLVTVGPGPDRPTLDRASTVIASGGSLTDPSHAGLFVLFGFGFPSDHPCDPCCKCGVEFSGFFVAQKGDEFLASSQGVPAIGRPFIDVTNGVPVQVVQDVAGVAPPLGQGLSGSVLVNSQSSMGGIEANGVCQICCDGCQGYKVELLVGGRVLSLSEELSVSEDLTAASGERIFVRDNFTTRNRFFGGQVGLRGEKCFGSLFVQGTAKVALGATLERVYIDGYTLDQAPGFEQVRAAGGLLAQRSNIGRHYHNEFSFVPEAQLRVGYQVNEMLRLSAGYTFLWISNVLRPGDQIDLAVNTRQLAQFGPGVVLPAIEGGPARPAFQFNQNSFWAQGVTAGVELRY